MIVLGLSESLQEGVLCWSSVMLPFVATSSRSQATARITILARLMGGARACWQVWETCKYMHPVEGQPAPKRRGSLEVQAQMLATTEGSGWGQGGRKRL